MTFKNLTTKKHFQIFQKEAEYWIKEFGLLDWEIDYLHKDNQDSKNMAWTSYDYQAKHCSIILGKDWGEWPVSNFQIRMTAFHEVCEVLTAELSCLAETRVWDAVLWANVQHSVIHRLENVVFKKEKK